MNALYVFVRCRDWTRTTNRASNSTHAMPVCHLSKLNKNYRLRQTRRNDLIRTRLSKHLPFCPIHLTLPLPMLLHPFRHDIRETLPPIPTRRILTPILLSHILQRQQYPLLDKLIVHEIDRLRLMLGVEPNS
ncbi:hypothetical protein HBI79_050740 [Parastagonospora nodorum]|nr:hypothetical protein HBI79_050740 [Parastagonospora nodorum]